MKTLKEINKGCGKPIGDECLIQLCYKDILCPQCQALKEQMEGVIELVNSLYGYELEDDNVLDRLLNAIKGKEEIIGVVDNLNNERVAELKEKKKNE